MGGDALGQKADDIASVIVEEIAAGDMPPDEVLRAVIERLSASLLMRTARDEGREMMDPSWFDRAATDLMKGAARQIIRAFDLADEERRKTDAIRPS